MIQKKKSDAVYWHVESMGKRKKKLKIVKVEKNIGNSSKIIIFTSVEKGRKKEEK